MSTHPELLRPPYTPENIWLNLAIGCLEDFFENHAAFLTDAEMRHCYEVAYALFKQPQE